MMAEQNRLEPERHACEVRMIAALPDKDARRKWLADIAKLRGKEARDRIIAGLKETQNASCIGSQEA